MRYDCIDPFVSSTIRVLDSVIQSDIARGTLALLKKKDIFGDIIIVIRMKGDTDGTIMVTMETSTALKVCSTMNGMEFDSLTAFGVDSISELANMIAGNAISALNDIGFDFRVTPPVVIIKEDVHDLTDDAEIFQIPLFTELGEITVNVAMRTT